MRGSIARSPLFVLGLGALLVPLLAGVTPDGDDVAESGELAPPLSVVRTWQVVAPTDGVPFAVDADNHYVLGPDEVTWNSFYDASDDPEPGEPPRGVLPFEPQEPFTIVADIAWVNCFDLETLEPISEAERADPWPYPYTLSVDGVPVEREDLLIPCTGEPVADPMASAGSTQAVMRWRFSDGLAEGTYLFELSSEPGAVTEDLLFRILVQVVPHDDADGADGADGAEPIVVPRPERVETGAGGTADSGTLTPSLVLLGAGVMIATRTYVRRTR
jgi:hypothetical protein